MDVSLLIIRLVLFAIFALAAMGKFLDLKGSEKAVKDFGTPEEFAKTFAIALPFAELVFAFCFLFLSTSWVGAIGGLILLLTFIGGMIWQMAKGNAPDCHCFGQIHSEPVGTKSLVRNIIFAILALVLIAQGRDGQGMSLTEGSSDTMQILLMVLVLVLIGAALFYLKKVLDNQALILRRLELLEIVSREGVPLDRGDAGHPQDGLPIGAPFPDFELDDAAGTPVSLRSLLAAGKPTLLFFVSPTCDPCKALLPEMERWDAELGERVNFVLMSNGDGEANRAKFGGVFADGIILQDKREVADAVLARWTPTALLVRADGTIGSHLAAGDGAIRELVDQLRTADLSSDQFYVPTATGNGGRPPKIGQPVPDFELKDINGNVIRSADLRGRETLAVFWSLTCPHCTAMMTELKSWDRSRTPSDPQLIVFSDGAREDHEDLGLEAPVILDAGYKTAEKLGMFGTPSAVLIDEKGNIVTETGVGASNVWALIGRRSKITN